MTWALHAQPMYSSMMPHGTSLALYEQGSWTKTNYTSVTLEWEEIEVVWWAKHTYFTLRRAEESMESVDYLHGRVLDTSYRSA